MKKEKLTRIYSWILASVFFAFISSVMVLKTVLPEPDKAVSKQENRYFAPKPDFDINHLDPYPIKYEHYYNDRFPFRSVLLPWWTNGIYFTLYHKAPPSTKVDIGIDDWLFPVSERAAFEGSLQLSRDSVELLHQTLRNRAIALAHYGIRFYVFFVPMKSSIYPEFTPFFYKPSVDSTLYDRIVQVLKRDTLINFIDLKPFLISVKPKAQLYGTTDNHWNFIGSYYAYRMIIDRIAKDFPAINKTLPLKVEFKPTLINGGNLAIMMGLQEVFRENEYRATIIPERAVWGRAAGYKPPPWFGYPSDFEWVMKVPDSTLPKVVVIRDSFFTNMLKYFSQHFRKSVYIFDAWMYEYNWDIIKNEKPDLVVLQVYEPLLPHIIHRMN